MRLETSDFDKKSLKYIDKNGQNRCVVAPDFDLGKNMCAKYARLAAEIIFGIKYIPANAWNLKYVNDFVLPKGRLENGSGGDVITFFYPSSRYNTRGKRNLDVKGNARSCTHAGLLYGFNNEGEPVIIHQFKSIIETGFSSIHFFQ